MGLRRQKVSVAATLPSCVSVPQSLPSVTQSPQKSSKMTLWMSATKSEGSISKKPLQVPVAQWPTTILPSLTSSAGSLILCTNRVGEKACKCNGQTSQQLEEAEEQPRSQTMTICTHDSQVMANACQCNGLSNQTLVVCSHKSKLAFYVESASDRFAAL